MKKLILLILCILVFPLTSFAEPFKVGLILSMTGSWGEFGEAQKQAIELARKDHPKLFTDVEFIYEDCGYASKNAVTAFNKLRTIDKVDAMFVWGVEPSLALAPLAESYKIPLFVSALDPRASKGKQYVVRTINYALQHSEKMSEYLRSQGFKNIGILQAELSFFNVLIDGLKTNKAEGETIEVVDSMLPNQVDFRSTISKLKTKKFDAIGLYLVPAQVTQFYKQAAEQGYQVPTFGTTTFQSKTVIEQAGGEMDGAVFVHNFVTDDFQKRYMKAYGDDIQIPWAANAYDFAVLIGDIVSTGKTNKDTGSILTAVSNIKNKEGVGGEYRFIYSDKVGSFLEYPLSVYQVKGSRYVVVGSAG